MAESFEIDELDKKILHYLVDYPHMSKKKIAENISVTEATVFNRMKKPAFIKARQDLLSTTTELMERAQKTAARRLLALIKHHDPKVALEAVKLALGPLTNRRQVDTKTEVIFQTRIGDQGQLMQEMIEVGNNRKPNTSAIPEISKEPQGVPEDIPNDTQNSSSVNSNTGDNDAN